MLQTKNVLKILGIDRERIKYYKKKGVFVAESERLGYYTENDMKNLKRLVLLGKAGLTCDDIKKVQRGEITLMEALDERRKKIEEKKKRMESSLRLAEIMLDCGVQYEFMKTDSFWDIVTERENEGEKFMEVDEGSWQISLVRTIECPHCQELQDIDLEDYLYDESSYEKENGMGPDAIYSFDCEDNCECPFCGKKFRLSGWIREYPIGAYDSEDIIVEGLVDEEGE
ncbi:MerR family transcriptional regulator [Hungatella hathewayi]|uniref:MerR family transcriptional regulator n=1 Tax=Hungatella hathewayi TaxID=154046 RepID=UPI0035681FAC